MHCHSISISLALVSLVILESLASNMKLDPSAPWMTFGLTPLERAKKLVANMTLAEKITMLHGTSGDYVGNIAGNTRLGIPPLLMNDGPQGFRDNAHPGTTTQFPSGLCIAASWDPDFAFNWGSAMGREFVVCYDNALLSPAFLFPIPFISCNNRGLSRAFYDSLFDALVT